LGRVLRLTPRYVNDCHALAPARSPASRGISRVLRDLVSEDDLPAPGDVRTLLAAEGSQIQVFVHGRRVPGRNLWIWYRVTESEVRLEALTQEL
jgi:hypothetical protein